MKTITTEIEFDQDTELSLLHNGLEENFRLIEDALGVVISSRGNKVFLQGAEAPVSAAMNLINELRSIGRTGKLLRPEDIRHYVRAYTSGAQTSLTELSSLSISVSPKKRPIMPKTDAQKEYVEAIRKYDITIGIGPAGTGKTYLAMAMAVNALLKKEVSRLVLARPAVEAGERLGFLPGDMYEKVNPYLRPLYDALYDMMDADKALRLIEQGIIEIAPLAFMRGRTLNDSFIILDEAQNTTSEQMKMYLTRLGFNSKTVITGDVTQIDLPSDKVSGLVEAEQVLSGIEGIKIIRFTERDVVRHSLVQEIIKAYDKHEKRRQAEQR